MHKILIKLYTASKYSIFHIGIWVTFFVAIGSIPIFLSHIKSLSCVDEVHLATLTFSFSLISSGIYSIIVKIISNEETIKSPLGFGIGIGVFVILALTICILSYNSLVQLGKISISEIVLYTYFLSIAYAFIMSFKFIYGCIINDLGKSGIIGKLDNAKSDVNSFRLNNESS